MNSLFYPKLAAGNIKKNGKTYIPYILTCCFTTAMFYMIRSLCENDGIKNLVGADTIQFSLNMGSLITSFFVVIFLFYTNSFLMKRRKKEFGLFNILGMEKKHLTRVIAYETLYIAAISFVVGIFVGVALDKVMYLLVLKLMNENSNLGFYISKDAMESTLLLFSSIYLLIFLNSMRQIHLAKPIELLNSGNTGEKEPKTKWIMTILGVILLGSGYYIAITTKNPITALALFFVAVFLVILGTYFLFTAGSIALLKMLKKNKKYYYKSNHFISVSGMIYRMKQNAVGLANICVLSTMVLVMVSSTASMMIGMENIMKNRYPYDITIYSKEQELGKNRQLTEEARNIMIQAGLVPENEIAYNCLVIGALRMGEKFSTDREANNIVLGDINNLIFVPLEEYNKFAGRDVSLRDDEILLYTSRGSFKADEISVFDRDYRIMEHLDSFIGNGAISANVATSQFIVVKDMDEVMHIFEQQKEVYGENASTMDYVYSFNLACEDTQEIEAYKQLNSSLKSAEFHFYAESKVESRSSFMSLYGGLFFIGMFLGILFIAATILIIYYKQISEGYDDKERFEIMQKVGMSHSEVKRAIHSQIMTVFFLPLVMAAVHVVFAFPFISRILEIMNLTNITLYVICTLCVLLVFVAMYSIIYAVTAKVYYKIVSR